MTESLRLRLLHLLDRGVARYASLPRQRTYFRWRADRLLDRMNRARAGVRG